MQIEMWNIDRVKEYANNPRINSDAVAPVAESIRQFGFKVPVVVDRDGTLVTGHTRIRAARQLGLKQVPVIKADDLTPEQVRAFRIADNKLHELSSWNIDLLPIELSALQEMNFPLDVLGFDADELARLMSEDVRPGLVDPDDVPDVPKAPVTKSGDLWLLGDHRLLCGDSTRGADVAHLLGRDSARMLFTDPPWGVAIGLDSNPRHRQRKGLANDDLEPEQFQQFLDGFITAVGPHVEGDVYCVLGASEWPRLDATLRSHGFHWSATIIWAKDVFVLGRSKYHRRYEPIWYGWREKAKSSFVGKRDVDDVWEIPRPKRSEEHPTMKPVQLAVRAILNSSVPGDIVLDSFGGAGSTLIAAEQTGRMARLIEIDPGFCEVVVRRWERFTGRRAQREQPDVSKRKTPATLAGVKKAGKRCA